MVMPPERLTSKVEGRLYPLINLLSIVEPIRGSRERRHSEIHTMMPNGTESLIRAFTDRLSYLCDYKKGGLTVTSIAIEGRPEGPVFHAAANQGFCERAEDLLRFILTNLQQATMGRQREIEDLILSEAIGLGEQRVNFYRNSAIQSIEATIECRDIILERFDDERATRFFADLSSLLGDLEDAEEGDMVALTKRCYEARQQPLFGDLDSLMIDEGRAEHFRDLRHFLGRLGAHVYAAKVVVRAALVMPNLVRDFSICVVTSAVKNITVKLTPAKAQISGVAGRWSSNEQKAEDIERVLREFDRVGNLNIDEQFAENVKLSTSVHAELLLTDHFWREGLEFAHGVRYVGCSKPACFLCWKYIQQHPSRIIVPDTHKKLWRSWYPPLLPKDAEPGAQKERTAIVNNIIQMLRQEIEGLIRPRTSGQHRHFDSTTGRSFVTEDELIARFRMLRA